MKPVVIHIIANLERAGAQECLCTLAENWPRNDIDILVCSLQDGPLRTRFEQAGIGVEIVPRPRCTFLNLPLYMAELWRIRRSLIRLVRTRRVDLAQTHILSVFDFLVLSLRWTGHLKRVLWTIHGRDFLPMRPGALLRMRRYASEWLYRALADRVDGFIAVSDGVYREIVDRIGPEHGKIFTIKNGVDVGRYQEPDCRRALCDQLRIAYGARLVLTVGRLLEEKGHRHLIEAAAIVISNHPNTHFLFAGQGELSKTLQAGARRTGFGENIHFLGVRDDVPQLLSACDLFVLPSLWEGLSMALLEAMAAGKAIVATAVPGTDEVILPGKTGLSVPPSDSASLAKAINTLLDDPLQAETLGREAKQLVLEKHNVGIQARQYSALYCRLLSGA